MIEIALPRIHLVGMGEVGQRLAGALGRAGIATHPVTRTRGWDEARDDSDGLCLVCVREESLAEVLETLHNVPSDRLAEDDLIFNCVWRRQAPPSSHNASRSNTLMRS
jgi:ketopantoate reductase